MPTEPIPITSEINKPDFLLIGDSKSPICLAVQGKLPAAIMFGGIGDFDKTPKLDGQDPFNYFGRFAELSSDSTSFAYALYNTPASEKKEYDPKDPTTILDLPVSKSLILALKQFHEVYPYAKVRLMGNSYGALLILANYYAAIKEICEGNKQSERYQNSVELLSLLSQTAQDIILIAPPLGFHRSFSKPNIVLSKLAAKKSRLMTPLRHLATRLLEGEVDKMYSGAVHQFTREQIIEHSLEKIEQVIMMSSLMDELLRSVPERKTVMEKLRALGIERLPQTVIVVSNKDHQLNSDEVNQRALPLAEAKLTKLLKLDSPHWQSQDMHSPFMGNLNELLKLLIDATLSSTRNVVEG